jgi:hypothetical protein
MTPAQCRAARGLINMSQSQLGFAAVVPLGTIIDFEAEAMPLKSDEIDAASVVVDLRLQPRPRQKYRRDACQNGSSHEEQRSARAHFPPLPNFTPTSPINSTPARSSACRIAARSLTRDATLPAS